MYQITLKHTVNSGSQYELQSSFSSWITRLNQHKCLKSLCQSSRGGHKDFKKPDFLNLIALILSQVAVTCQIEIICLCIIATCQFPKWQVATLTSNILAIAGSIFKIVVPICLRSRPLYPNVVCSFHLFEI